MRPALPLLLLCAVTFCGCAPRRTYIVEGSANTGYPDLKSLCQDYLTASKKSDLAKIGSFILKDGLSQENLRLNQALDEAAKGDPWLRPPEDAKIKTIEEHYFFPSTGQQPSWQEKPVELSLKPDLILHIRLESASDKTEWPGMNREFKLPVVERNSRWWVVPVVFAPPVPAYSDQSRLPFGVELSKSSEVSIFRTDQKANPSGGGFGTSADKKTITEWNMHAIDLLWPLTGTQQETRWLRGSGHLPPGTFAIKI